MKAVGFTQRALPIEHAQALVDLDLPDPGPPQGRDLLVRVHGVSVNPRDMKSRMTWRRRPPARGAGLRRERRGRGRGPAG